MTSPRGPVGDASTLLQSLLLPSAERADRTALYTEGGAVEQRQDAPVLVVGQGATASLATYFNAFPAAYWRRWTPLTRVSLTVVSSGGGTLTVWRSDADARAEAVRTVALAEDGSVTVDLPLDGFEDGGLYWADVTAGDAPVLLRRADWNAPDAVAATRTTIAITTMDRPAFTVPLLRALTGSAELHDLVHQIAVVDQGARPLADVPEAAALAAADPRIRLLRQANLGGSGGFARGMLEALQAGSDSVLLLDDDVEVEPESIRRAIAFAARCSDPTIVGAQMLDLNAPTVLHSGAEAVTLRDFMWRSLTPLRHDFATGSLRSTAFLHRRWDAGYNGWWMCLIPTSVLREIGLSLPAFIKWDDAEFGVRARAAGIPTVTLPGCAIWHVAWIDKNDSRDWQAFYHARNRLLAAVLHSGARRGGRLLLQNLAIDVRFLLTMDYSTFALRQEAYRSILAGPDRLAAELGERLPALRALRSGYEDGRAVDSLPAGVRRLTLRGAEGAEGAEPGAARALLLAARRFGRHLLVPPRARGDVAVSAREARWWAVSALDRVYVEAGDRRSYTHHTRDLGAFRTGLRETVSSFVTMWRRWPSLRRDYREALPRLTSADTWRRLVGLDRAD
ncbi:glycosyltransferase [Naasia sp. SYSU D00948]|uniref:glycosyltransferase n=1 Tax=Naasia sp. SYSU D00948 TaxID=2817379 RepID=UPI001B30DE44|nr:glycosyltransferase [Naasia sp. SYSU D00948]